MKYSARLHSLCNKGMVESMGIELMIIIARKVFHNYDINKRTGFPDSIPIPKKDAAAQIIRDAESSGRILQLVQVLVEIHLKGHMGREYPITNIREILREMFENGYLYDQECCMFVENSDVQRTRNWGVICEGEDYPFTLLRLDIIGNSKLVRKYPADMVNKAYEELRKIVVTAVEKRNGRIWIWEGDGGVAAFYFSRKNVMALLAGMEIVHDLFLYNITECPFEQHLGVRMAIHSGSCVYTEDLEKLKKSEVIKKAAEIESKYTKPNSLSISNTVWQGFDELIMQMLVPIETGNAEKYYGYELRWES